ncbi:MAG: hypothetical protein LKJ47_00320 [Bifidobacteriaceae bacterium]|jgi:hypothetical protein|nr:hypothetical protein [Bifidobacteriaceae bacterium]
MNTAVRERQKSSRVKSTLHTHHANREKRYQHENGLPPIKIRESDRGKEPHCAYANSSRNPCRMKATYFITTKSFYLEDPRLYTRYYCLKHYEEELEQTVQALSKDTLSKEIDWSIPRGLCPGRFRYIKFGKI